MKQRTAWLVTCIASAAVVVAFYAVVRSQFGGDLAPIAGLRKHTQPASTASDRNWKTDAVAVDAVATGEWRDGPQGSEGRDWAARLLDRQARKAIPGNRDCKAHSDHRDRKVRPGLKV